MTDKKEVFAGGKDDLHKEPFHLIPEMVARELFEQAHGESKYTWIKVFSNICDEERLAFYEALEMVKDVLKFGAEKYAPDSWKFVDDAQNRYCGAMMRHALQRMEEKETDPESGLSHIAHELCNVMFLAWFEITENE